MNQNSSQTLAQNPKNMSTVRGKMSRGQDISPYQSHLHYSYAEGQRRGRDRRTRLISSQEAGYWTRLITPQEARDRARSEAAGRQRKQRGS